MCYCIAIVAAATALLIVIIAEQFLRQQRGKNDQLKTALPRHPRYGPAGRKTGRARLPPEA